MRSLQGKAQKKRKQHDVEQNPCAQDSYKLRTGVDSHLLFSIFFSFLLPPPKLGANTIPLWWTFNPLPHFERVISPRAIELYELLYILIKMKGTDEFSMDIFHLFLFTYSQVFFLFFLPFKFRLPHSYYMFLGNSHPQKA